jgi:tetratricopeptide (TPR) repeat protein
MILRLSDSLARGIVVVIALLLGLLLSFFSVRAAIAEHEGGGDSEKQLRLAVRLEPGNPVNWYRLGRHQQYNLENPDSAAAEESYKKAIALNPWYTDAWLDLGTAYELDGNFDQARAAYLKAKKSYPVSADVSWRYGNFLLRQGDQVEAYTELRRAIEADPHRAAAAFSRAYRANPNIDEILDQLLPAKQSVYVDVITEAVGGKQLAVAETVWGRLMALQPRLGVRDVDHLVGALLASGDYSAARRVWDQGTSTMDLPPLLQPVGSVIWDPSFETEMNGASFSWLYHPISQGVIVGLDRTEKLNGLQSLRLAFDGKHNPNLDAACILAVVQPKTTYYFSAWLKTNSITTENGVEFRVFTPDDFRAQVLKTHEYHGTLPWTLVDGDWTTSATTHRANVCVTREPSDNPEVRISGTAWIDDVNLVAKPSQRTTERRRP